MATTPEQLKLKYRFAANYGLILGGYISFFFLADLFLPTLVANFLNLFGFFATPYLCYLLSKKYRDKALNGYIRFGQVWSFGVWLFFFAGLITSVFYYIRYEFIQPDYLKEVFNQAVVMMKQFNYPQDQINALNQIGTITVTQVIFFSLWFFIVGGAILFLLISGLVVKKPPFNDNNDYTPYANDQKNSDNNQSASNS